MYENQFSQNNRDALGALMYSVDAVKSVNVNKLSDVIDTSLCSDPEWVHKQNELFNSAEHWLNSKGIKTRTEYGNLLPTYNLFIEIGKYIEEQNSKELKDCPFCGSHVEMKSDILGTPFGRYSYSSGYEFSIKCDECGCTTTECHTTTVNMTEDEAKAKVANAWNERHE